MVPPPGVAVRRYPLGGVTQAVTKSEIAADNHPNGPMSGHFGAATFA